MTIDEAASQLLPFDAPEQPLPVDFSAAEQGCLSFLPKFLDRYRKLKGENDDARASAQKMWEEKEDLRNKLDRYLVRNLLPLVDQCKLAMSLSNKSAPPVDDPMATMKAVPDAPAEEGVTVLHCVKSIERQILSLLSEMGIERVELMGKSYENVVVDGETIPEPFEILHISVEDKSQPVIVTEVIQDLWITRKHGSIQILRKGQVNC